MLEINDLHQSYDRSKEILHGISLNVKDGEIFGFLGHNGAGKTTTIRCATGLLEFDSGSIRIDGVDITKDPIGVKEKTAYLPDNPDLYENLTGVEYLNFIADVFQVDAKTREEKMTSLGKELEIYDSLGDQLKGYSHGMKQKVALISALMHSPKLIVMDEPFVGLDPKATYTAKQKMKELCANGGSVFFSCHVLEVVQNLCDEVAILNHGEIVRRGSVEELTDSGESLEQVFLESEKDA
jgi:ABC-2 type transport system ATP-binding protein